MGGDVKNPSKGFFSLGKFAAFLEAVDAMKRGSIVALVALQSFPGVAATTAAINETGPWWIGHLVTFLGIVVAASMIVFQLGRQHQNELNRQNENFKGQLKLQIYQEFSQRLASASEAVGIAGLYAMGSHTHSVIYAKQISQGMTPSPVAERALLLLDKQRVASDEAVGVSFLFEKYQVVHPDFDIFLTAISAASHDLGVAFRALFDFMLIHFPVDARASADVDNVKVLKATELEDLHALASEYQRASMALDCYLSDMRVELQKLLLGHLFEAVVPRRRPADPSVKVVTLEPANVKSLRQHFLKNTAWGKSTVESIFAVHREYNK